MFIRVYPDKQVLKTIWYLFDCVVFKQKAANIENLLGHSSTAEQKMIQIIPFSFIQDQALPVIVKVCGVVALNRCGFYFYVAPLLRHHATDVVD